MREDGGSTWSVLLLTWSAMECFLFAGYNSAWPSLVALYKMDGVYSHLCEPLSESSQTIHTVFRNSSYEEVKAKESGALPLLHETHVPSCPEQDEAFNFAFTLAVIVRAPPTYAVAHLNHKYGLRATRLIAVLLLALGFACLALGSKEFPSPVFVGLSVLTTGSSALFICGNQVAYQFKAKGATAAALISGASLGGAGVVTQLFHLGHNHGITTRQSFAFVGSLLFFSLLATFHLFPKGFFTSEDRKNIDTSGKLAFQGQAVPETDDTSSSEPRSTTRKVSSDNGPVTLESSRKWPLLRTVAAPQFCLLLPWSAVNTFLFSFSRGTLNAWLHHVTNSDQPKVIHMTSVYSNVTMLCLPVALLSGSLFDFITECLPDRIPYRGKVYVSSAVCLGLGSLLGAAICACAMMERLELVYVMLVLMMVHIVFLLSFVSAFLLRMYREENFGVLFYISNLATVPFTFLGIPLFSWCESDSHNWSQLYWCLLLLSLSTLAHPAYLLSKARASMLHHQPARKDGDVSKL